MKAILKYGQFTAMIELPKPLHTISIMKPMESLSFVPLTETEIHDLGATKRLEFRILKELSENIWLYDFVGEF